MKSKLIGNLQAIRMAERLVQGNMYMPVLITGEAGLGQEILAMEIAAEILGVENPEEHGNYFALKPKQGTIRVSDVEELLEISRISAHKGSPKVLGIYSIGCMTIQAQNRLLKLLEDRNEKNVILITLEGSEGAVLDTIKSRTVHIPLKRVSTVEMKKFLKKMHESEDLDVYMAVLRGCPYRYASTKEKIDVYKAIYHKQLEIRGKEDILYMLHEAREKDRNAFYDKNRECVQGFLDMEFSIFEKLLLWKEGGIQVFADPRYRNLNRQYSEQDVYRILLSIVEQKRRIGIPGQYTRLDFSAFIRELCQ